MGHRVAPMGVWWQHHRVTVASMPHGLRCGVEEGVTARRAATTSLRRFTVLKNICILILEASWLIGLRPPRCFRHRAAKEVGLGAWLWGIYCPASYMLIMRMRSIQKLSQVERPGCRLGLLTVFWTPEPESIPWLTADGTSAPDIQTLNTVDSPTCTCRLRRRVGWARG